MRNGPPSLFALNPSQARVKTSTWWPLSVNASAARLTRGSKAYKVYAIMAIRKPLSDDADPNFV
jgi:hypothetical protein